MWQSIRCQSSSLSDCKASTRPQRIMDTFGPNPTANNKVKLEVFDSYNEDTKRNRWPQYTQEQNRCTGARGQQIQGRMPLSERKEGDGGSKNVGQWDRKERWECPHATSVVRGTVCQVDAQDGVLCAGNGELTGVGSSTFPETHH